MKELLDTTLQTLLSGGPSMVALALLCVILYYSIFTTYRFIVRIRKAAANRAQLKLAVDDSQPSAAEIRIQFREIIRKRIRLSRTLVVAAPLLGLLGTVMGMLDTFQALSRNKSADTTLSVADGISMALITTQAGLMIALPALFLIEWTRRQSKHCEKYLYLKKGVASHD